MWKQPVSNRLEPAWRTQRTSPGKMSPTAVIAVAAGWGGAVSCLLLVMVLVRSFA